jgi:hypothetical protein
VGADLRLAASVSGHGVGLSGAAALDADLAVAAAVVVGRHPALDVDSLTAQIGHFLQPFLV